MKLIKINPEHFIIVDDSEIKEGDWVIELLNKVIFQLKVGGNNYSDSTFKKITHSTKPLEEFVDNEGIKRIGWTNIKVLELSEVKELIGGVDMDLKGFIRSY